MLSLTEAGWGARGTKNKAIRTLTIKWFSLSYCVWLSPSKPWNQSKKYLLAQLFFFAASLISAAASLISGAAL
jgi:hypothetical protein